ncbi:hypothetical protein NMG60_11020163 [Bertholletia excelsa]
MASEREIFNLSGPLHLTSADWTNLHYRRSAAACLVQGVYVLERDRQQKRQGPEALAPSWWDFFHFQINHLLVDNTDLSIFGAVYEFKFPAPYFNYSIPNPPRYVIAFRGTITKSDTRSQDLKLDIKYIQNRLHLSARFQHAMEAVQNTVAVAGAANIWLAGHSLGSAIALLVGKNMARMGCHIETYLFNPPFISAPLEHIKNKKLKHGIRFANSVLTAGVAVAVNGIRRRPKKDNSFVKLSGWIPYLFVNPSDPICSEYIGYFEHRLKMMEIGAGTIASIATQNSIGVLLSSKQGGELEPPHLLPSAYLTTNLSPSGDFKQAHGIHQWWKPSLQFQSTLHQFK